MIFQAFHSAGHPVDVVLVVDVDVLIEKRNAAKDPSAAQRKQNCRLAQGIQWAPRRTAVGSQALPEQRRVEPCTVQETTQRIHRQQDDDNVSGRLRWRPVHGRWWVSAACEWLNGRMV